PAALRRLGSLLRIRDLLRRPRPLPGGRAAHRAARWNPARSPRHRLHRPPRRPQRRARPVTPEELTGSPTKDGVNQSEDITLAPPAGATRLRGAPVARAVFTGLPARYDRLAYLLSLGQDRRWRRAVTDHAAAAPPTPPRLVLDVATGPAGVALAVAARTGADV